jgi:hypothetical protein
LRGQIIAIKHPLKSRPGETDAIRAMQRRLKRSRVAVWINPQDGKLTPQEITSDVLAAKAAANVSVRLR